ncbi:MAG: methyltransferase [Pseudomonadota bacterium]
MLDSTAVGPDSRGSPKPGGWREALYRRRDRLLSDPEFQRRLARIPLIRRLARKPALRLHAITSGFVYSQVLFAGFRLGLFELLQQGPMSSPDIAAKIGLPVDGTERLLKALTGIGLLQRRNGDQFGLGELGAATLGNPGIAAMVEHHQELYADLLDPVNLLQARNATRLSAFWTYAREEQHLSSNGAAEARYSQLMSVSQGFVAEHILTTYSLKRHRRLLDVAGGDGSFLTEALSRWPHLEGSVFDLPPVAKLAEQRLADAGLAFRARAFPGNMLADPLPQGADVISLVRVLHDHDDEAVMTLLRAAHAALADGGRLLIAEPLAGTRGAEAIGDTYFGIYLWAMGSGEPRSAERLSSMLQAAGFSRCRELTTAMPMLVRVLIADQ